MPAQNGVRFVVAKTLENMLLMIMIMILASKHIFDRELCDFLGNSATVGWCVHLYVVMHCMLQHITENLRLFYSYIDMINI